MDKFNHPCKNTCSGWKQGFESAFQNNMKSYQDCINHLKQFVHLLSQSEDDLQKGDAATMLDQLNSIEIIVESNIL